MTSGGPSHTRSQEKLCIKSSTTLHVPNPVCMELQVVQRGFCDPRDINTSQEQKLEASGNRSAPGEARKKCGTLKGSPRLLRQLFAPESVIRATGRTRAGPRLGVNDLQVAEGHLAQADLSGDGWSGTAPATSQLQPALEETRAEHQNVHEGLGGESLNLASLWGGLRLGKELEVTLC